MREADSGASLEQRAWWRQSLAPGPVTARVLVIGDVVAGVDSHAHGLLVSLKSVVFRTPVTIHEVGIAIINAPLCGVWLASLITCIIASSHDNSSLLSRTHQACSPSTWPRCTCSPRCSRPRRRTRRCRPGRSAST